MVEGNEVRSQTGAVAAGPPEAARVGARVLEHGGNAMDAAAAASMACCMLQCQSTGVGGYVCCAVVLEGATNRVWALDANSVAPASAHEGMYRVLPARADPPLSINESEYDCSVRHNANVVGPLSVGPPGVMAGLGMLSDKWGRLAWDEIVRPSLDLIENGFPFGSTANAVRTMAPVIRQYEASVAHLMPGGRLPGPDDIWHRLDMARTLERVASAGWRDFYSGEVGRQIADHVNGAGGVLTREDMAGFEPRVLQPCAVRYREAEAFGTPGATGCLTSLQALNMLACLDPVPDDHALHWHQLAEVLKLAWRDRLQYVADPEHVPVPIERLLSPDYAAGRVETLRRFPEHVDRLSPEPSGNGSHGTLHISAADAEGNLVAVTISHGGAFGSCLTVPGTGVILGHGMCRLDPRPGRVNSVGPGKKPLTNVVPTILRLPDRDVAVGLPGGRRIVSVCPQMARQIVDNGASSHGASTAARMHVLAHEPVEVSGAVPREIVSALRGIGHNVEERKSVAGAAHCAEYLRSDGEVRAGGNTWAAGV